MDDNDAAVRVRFAPSPTGDLHVGNIRTALYNWAYARHTGGSLVFRLEDTDHSRSTEEACAAAIDTMRWLGLDWDEGVEVGGPDGPYRQSERQDIYRTWVQRFLTDGTAYHCYCTQDEVAARNKAAHRPPGYDNHCRSLSDDQVAAFVAEGREPVVRMKMPAGATSFDDMVRGQVTIDHAHVPDFVLVRADGHPLYTLAVAVDDVTMRITHVVRGEDLLSSTPRQVAVYRAMGVPAAQWPRFGHLPMVLGEDGQRLSKRNGVVSIAWYRREGFLPEAMCNYLALLGWSPGEDRELFTLQDMVDAFTVERVNRNPARFDIRKLEAINGDKIRGLDPEDFTRRLTVVLQEAGLVATPPSADEAPLVTGAAPLVQERIGRLTEIPDMLAFLFVDDAHFHVEEQAAAKVLHSDGAREVLEAAVGALDTLDELTVEGVEAVLRSALVDGLGHKPRKAFGPVRVAVTGRQVSPPLFESIALLGRARTLARLRAAAAQAR